jgi:hypothetical protein
VIAGETIIDDLEAKLEDDKVEREFPLKRIKCYHASVAGKGRWKRCNQSGTWRRVVTVPANVEHEPTLALQL